MITDIQQLINACEQELHDREYHAHHADFITNEWKGISQWCQKKNYTEFSQDIGFQYCDEISAVQKRHLSAGISTCIRLISFYLNTI